MLCPSIKSKPTQSELDFLGLTWDDIAADYEKASVFLVFPENWNTVVAFDGIKTQWRVSDGVVIGLDYSTIPFELEMLDIPRKEWPEVNQGLKVMEDVFIQHFREKK